MVFFTLIHVSEKESSIHNNFVTDISSQIRLYLSCAEQLASELKKHGIELKVITNNMAYLKRLMPAFTHTMVELSFSPNVPSGIKFYSAHFKLQVFSYLSKLQEEYVGLVDSDIVCINGIPEALSKAIANKTPLYYDITHNVVPAYGKETIIRNKQRLSDGQVTEMWAGGEFITGSPSFFGRLDKEIKALTGSYFEHYQSMHHQGDEVLTTLALEKLKTSEEILDAGKLNIISRFWSVKPKHKQGSVDDLANRFLLHLPSDKPFIHHNKQVIYNGDFLKAYKSYVFRKRIMRALFGSFIPMAKSILTSIASVKAKLKTPEKLVITSNTNSTISKEKGIKNITD